MVKYALPPSQASVSIINPLISFVEILQWSFKTLHERLTPSFTMILTANGILIPFKLNGINLVLESYILFYTDYLEGFVGS